MKSILKKKKKKYFTDLLEKKYTVTIKEFHMKYLTGVITIHIDFLKKWDQYKHVPLGVLAHSTHVRGAGRFEGGQEYPRVKVTLSSQISSEDCERLSLAYQNPDEIDIHEWENRESEGILYVPKAGEMLYRVRN